MCNPRKEAAAEPSQSRSFLFGFKTRLLQSIRTLAVCGGKKEKTHAEGVRKTETSSQISSWNSSEYLLQGFQGGRKTKRGVGSCEVTTQALILLSYIIFRELFYHLFLFWRIQKNSFFVSCPDVAWRHLAEGRVPSSAFDVHVVYMLHFVHTVYPVTPIRFNV